MSLTNARLVTENAASIALPRMEAIPPLARQENIIRNALGKAIKEVGAALMAIHDQRLYSEAGFSRFENYCEQVWGFKGSRAYQYIDFHKVVRELSTNVETRGMPLPRTEAQTRPLLRLADADSRTAVWKDVLDNDGERATKAKVEDAVDYHLAIESDPAWRDHPRDDVVRQFREAAAIPAGTRRSSGRGLPKPSTPALDDTSPPWDFRSVRAMVALISMSPCAWLSTLDETERPKVNDLIGDLHLLAETLEEALISFTRKGSVPSGEEGGDVESE